MKTMKKAILLFTIFVTIHSFADVVKVNSDNQNTFFINHNSYTAFQFTSSVPLIDFKDESTPNGIFTKIEIPDYGYSTRVGEPGLPVLKKLIEIPVDAEIEINILSKSFIEYDLSELGINYPLYPVQAPISKNIDDPGSLDLEINQSIYQTDEFYELELVRIENIGVMRGVQLARLEVSPVQYNPVKKILRVIDELEVEINFRNANVILTQENKQKFFSPFFESLYRNVINYKPIEKKELVTAAPVTFVIVSDPMFEVDLQPFIQWKTRKGFRVIEAYTDDPAVGNTSISIKAYLENIYYNPPVGYHPQSFVLIAGDVAQVPSFDGTFGGHVTDLYYVEYTGDMLPECITGRFSANDLDELNAYIDKTLEYEMFEFPEPQFLDTALIIAGEDSYAFGSGQINYATTYYLNQDHGIYPYVMQDPYSADTNYTELIIQRINNGLSFLNYTGHCVALGFAGPTLMLGNITALNNVHKYPVMVGNCCSSNNFWATCFGEVYTRSTDRGALSYIGASNLTYWNEDYWWAIGFEAISPNPVFNPENYGLFDRWFHENDMPLNEWYVTQGQFTAAGNLAVTQSGSSLEEYYWEVYHLMGDPSLTVYIPEPDLPQQVLYSPSILVGASSLTVETDPYLYIALSKEGVLHSAALSDEMGQAEIEIFEPLTETGTAEIIITGQNTRPFFGIIEILPAEGAYVVLDSFVIDDSNGNNDGIVDAGELIYLDVSLTNFGSLPASGLIASISSSDTNITLFNDPVNWDDILAGETSALSEICSFQVHDFCINGHEVEFMLEVTDEIDYWTSPFNIPIHSLISSVTENTDLVTDNEINIYPNPFADYFEVEYKMDTAEELQLSLFNILGKEVLTKKAQIPGQYKMRINTNELAPGIYFCKTKIGSQVLTQKVILSR